MLIKVKISSFQKKKKKIMLRPRLNQIEKKIDFEREL